MQLRPAISTAFTPTGAADWPTTEGNACASTMTPTGKALRLKTIYLKLKTNESSLTVMNRGSGYLLHGSLVSHLVYLPSDNYPILVYINTTTVEASAEYRMGIFPFDFV